MGDSSAELFAEARLIASDVRRPLGVRAEVASRGFPGADEGRGDGGLTPWVGIRADSLGVQAGFEVGEPGEGTIAYELAKLVQEEILVVTGKVWPATAEFAEHPLVPGESGWEYPGTGEIAVAYGEVSHVHERKPLPDGVVRWWLDPLDMGVLASDGGDVVFTYFDLEPDAEGARRIPRSGSVVRYEVSGRTRGAYRVAARVEQP